MNYFFICLFICFFSSKSFAWSWRGHHTVCEAATFLVEKKELRDYLTARLAMMGHLCNTPDFNWKSLGPEVNAIGNPTHYMDSELIGIDLKDVPLDYGEVIRRFENKPSAAKDGAKIFSIPKELGSSWWRTDQFFRRALAAGEVLKTAAVPIAASEQQNSELPFNKGVYDFTVNLGIMGHFVGDMSQPFHGSIDYDGYAAGHGGIHGFYEDAAVAIQPADLTLKIVQQGKKLKGLAGSKKPAYLRPGKNVVERMRDFTLATKSDLPKIYQIDPVITPSVLKVSNGLQLKTPAIRKSVDLVAKKFEPLIVKQMASSAALLALLWTEAYEKVGEPKLSSYKSYRYPFTPEFVPPDYYTLQK